MTSTLSLQTDDEQKLQRHEICFRRSPFLQSLTIIHVSSEARKVIKYSKTNSRLQLADSRVVKSLDCGAGPGLESQCRRKVLGSDGIICKYLPL